MCGIIGIISNHDVTDRIIDGLKRLEYRGYDSAGVATLDGKATIARRRAQGKLINLANLLQEQPIEGDVGIGHTRWATHGAPSTTNAHPHANDRVVVVHNGIIENYRSLQHQLIAKGYTFESETDSETVVHLIKSYLDEGISPQDAFAKALKDLHGAFALAVMIKDTPDVLYCGRHGSPLAIGYGDDEMFVGSDALALAPLTREICYLEEGDYGLIKRDSVELFDRDDNAIERPIRKTELSGALIGKGNYRHFMQKEIFEQPTTVGDCLHAYLNTTERLINLPDAPFEWGNIKRLSLIACGTSYYTAKVAKYWFEQISKLPVELDIASEFRYREPVLAPSTLYVFISQSGETADTVAALRYVKEHGNHCMSIVNVPESTMAREADYTLFTHAGPEIGVASTKAFTAQLTVLLSTALALAYQAGHLDLDTAKEMTQALSSVPALMLDVLKSDEILLQTAHLLEDKKGVLYLARGGNFPIALEGALKLKELAYIHAEGYAAGEMKHGPIALIDEHLPVVVLAPHDKLMEKTLSNMAEVQARGGQIILFTDKAGKEHIKDEANITVVEMPTMPAFITPLVYSLPVQLLAYHTAALKGTDVDQPRNLAKSVTVE